MLKRLVGFGLIAMAAGALLPASPLLAQPTQAVGTAPQRVVTATTGLVNIESDLQQADNATGVVTATGNVKIVYPDQRVLATARQAQYFSKENRVILSGDVDVVQEDGHSLKAERLVYLVDRERLTAQPAPGSQVVTKYQLNIAPTTTGKGP